METLRSLLQQRPPSLIPYKLKCDQEPLSACLGPPDFFPPSPNCAEESLNRDACQSGFKEIVDGIPELGEASLTLLAEPIWSKSAINKYREAARKCFKDLSNTTSRKRKAGQVYGVPLSGSLLAKPGLFPEQRHSSEDHRKKWIEDLAQNKRLKSLADHVPHGLRRRSLLEALIKNDVPFLRASWCIKICYLNQVRPMSIGMSSGNVDRSQLKRLELWTKDILDYMQMLLDELSQHGSGRFAVHDNSFLSHAGVNQQISDYMPANLEGVDLSPKRKWHYMSQLLQLHFSEGLLLRTQVLEWLLKQLQERDTLDAMELLLPLVLNFIDTIAICQTFLRTIVETCIRRLGELSSMPEVMDKLQHSYIGSFFRELLCYLVTVVPDSFVALDCSSMPAYICSSDGQKLLDSTQSKETSTYGEKDKAKSDTMLIENNEGCCNVRSVKHLLDVIRKRAYSLARAVNPSSLKKNEGSVIQVMDRALITGDIAAVYQCIFDDGFCGHENPPEEWLAKMNPWIKLGRGLSKNVSPLELFAVRFLCEWAICDIRDLRKVPSSADGKAMSMRVLGRVYMVVSVLCLRMKVLEMRNEVGTDNDAITAGFQALSASMFIAEDNCANLKNGYGYSGQCDFLTNFFQSPGPIHDLIVAWLDQLEQRKGGGMERLHMLLLELVNMRVFSPPAYVRQLIISGVLEKRETSVDLEHISCHRQLLQYLPDLPGLTTDEVGKNLLLSEAVRLYNNERRFALSLCDLHRTRASKKGVATQNTLRETFKSTETNNRPSGIRGPMQKTNTALRGKRLHRRKLKLMQLKQAIAACLHFPCRCVESICEVPNDKCTSWVANPEKLSVGMMPVTPGCEDCVRTKNGKTNEGNAVFYSVMPFDDDDSLSWWVKRPLKATTALPAVKLEAPASAVTLKLPKQATKGRPKAVRKLSLAQLATAKNEGGNMSGSQGTCSTYCHPFDRKSQCPYHKTLVEEVLLPSSQTKESRGTPVANDLKSIGAALKTFSLTEKRAIASWLHITVRTLIGRRGKLSPEQHSGSCMAGGIGAEESSNDIWQLGPEELTIIVYLLDLATDFCGLIKLLLWLLPKAIVSSSTQAKLMSISSWNRENMVGEIAETTILSFLQRYEGIMVVTNLVPDVLSAGLERAAIITATGLGRRATLFSYLYDLYKKYGGLASVRVWEKRWKASSDQKLLGEFEALKSIESEGNFALLGVAPPSVGDDRDDSIVPRLTGRLSKISAHMRDIVRRGLQEGINQMIIKEKESCIAKDSGMERCMDDSQLAQHVVTGLLECIKQHAVVALNGDVQLAAAGGMVIVQNAGHAIGFAFESIMANNSSSPISSILNASSRCAHHILRVHVQCLRLLKESFGDRQIKALEMAVALEANSVVGNGIGHLSGRASRSQFQLSPETPDTNSVPGDVGIGTHNTTLAKANAIVAAIAAFIVSLLLDGTIGLEKIISLLKIKENLEALSIFKNSYLTANGMSRAVPAMKIDSMSEVCLFWFRVLIGDCRNVAGGLIAEFLGEASMLAFVRMQRSLPLGVVLSPLLALFSIVLRSQHFSCMVGVGREDTAFQQLASSALSDLLAHDTIQEICLQDTRMLYSLLSRDNGDLEYASLLDSKGTDLDAKVSAMVPSRARLFLHALLDGKLPNLVDDVYTRNFASAKCNSLQVEALVHVLDNLQPATFHWQWIELRLLLNEQVFMEKLEAQSIPTATEAVQAARSSIEDGQTLSESEKNFTEIILTRLLVRPDSASLYSEALHLLGRALEDYLIWQVQWMLENNDMLFGRKSLRQQLEEMALRKNFKVGGAKTKTGDWWLPHRDNNIRTVDINKNVEVASPEEGEVAEDVEWMKAGKFLLDGNSDSSSHVSYFALEKALADLVLPCLAHCSTENLYIRFANRLVKQIKDLEQHISSLSRSPGKSVMATSEGVNRGSSFRSSKGSRGTSECGMAGAGRRMSSIMDNPPSSSAALQISLWLRLQFLLPLLPSIYEERDPAWRTLRSHLASSILHLLGTRVVQESTQILCFMQQQDFHSSGCNLDGTALIALAAAAAAITAGEGLFDRLLSVFHALSSSACAIWFKQKGSSKRNSKTFRALERETVQQLQMELDHMQLPSGIRARLQAAMPALSSAPFVNISASPPQLPTSVFSVLQAAGCNTNAYRAALQLDNTVKNRPVQILQEPDIEIDPWMLMEGGTGAGSSGGTGLVAGDGGNLKACSWLKGAVRIRRGDQHMLAL